MKKESEHRSTYLRSLVFNKTVGDDTRGRPHDNVNDTTHIEAHDSGNRDIRGLPPHSHHTNIFFRRVIHAITVCE
jgi:hypothetical protein